MHTSKHTRPKWLKLMNAQAGGSYTAEECGDAVGNAPRAGGINGLIARTAVPRAPSRPRLMANGGHVQVTPLADKATTTAVRPKRKRRR